MKPKCRSELAKEIVDRIGGVKALAGEFSVPESTVRNWTSMGIPGKWHARFMRLSSHLGVSVSWEELEQSMPPTKRSTA